MTMERAVDLMYTIVCCPHLILCYYFSCYSIPCCLLIFYFIDILKELLTLNLDYCVHKIEASFYESVMILLESSLKDLLDEKDATKKFNFCGLRFQTLTILLPYVSHWMGYLSGGLAFHSLGV